MIYHTSLGTLFLRAYAVYEGKRIVTVILLSSALVNHSMKLPIVCSLFFQLSIAVSSYVTVKYISASSSEIPAPDYRL